MGVTVCKGKEKEMTHEEFVDELHQLVQRMIQEYQATSGYALEFKSESDASHGRTLTISLKGNE